MYSSLVCTLIVLTVLFLINSIIRNRMSRLKGNLFWVNVPYLWFNIPKPNIFHEFEEQEMLTKYILPTDRVLVLGANVGTASILLDKLVDRQDLQYSVEPNLLIVPYLKYERDRHKCQFNIIDYVITESKDELFMAAGLDHVASRTVTNPSSGNKVRTGHLPTTDFNVLFADCEGCFPSFLKEYENELAHVRLVIFERDYETKVDSTFVDKILTRNGFTAVRIAYVTVYLKQE